MDVLSNPIIKNALNVKNKVMGLMPHFDKLDTTFKFVKVCYSTFLHFRKELERVFGENQPPAAGAVAVAAGVTGADAVEAGEVPMVLVAVTVKV